MKNKSAGRPGFVFLVLLVMVLVSGLFAAAGHAVHGISKMEECCG